MCVVERAHLTRPPLDQDAGSAFGIPLSTMRFSQSGRVLRMLQSPLSPTTPLRIHGELSPSKSPCVFSPQAQSATDPALLQHSADYLAEFFEPPNTPTGKGRAVDASFASADFELGMADDNSDDDSSLALADELEELTSMLSTQIQ